MLQKNNPGTKAGVGVLLGGEPDNLSEFSLQAQALADKLRTIAREIYHAAEVQIPPPIAARLQRFEDQGFGHFPICVAKTQYSFSAEPTKLGAPEGHVLPVREVRLSAGAGFVVAVCGDIMTMPGLPRRPAAESIGLDASGAIQGLF